MPRSLLRRAKLFVLPFLALAFGYSAANAQTIVNSDGPSKVAITVYRDANRGDQPIRPNWPGGYALITETRTVSIPAGESVIRFEGVSEGMYPESAIVTGLPRGVKEKNRDARLLSPAGLVDAYLKREVTLMRTDRATGKVREQTAMITAGPTGGVILETGEGYEALRCTGLPERLKFARVPADLAAKPTLSVITQSDRAVTATVTLTYMAAGFDWQANYVIHAGKFSPANEVDLDVFAWLTVANGGNQSFNDAELQVVAGRLNKRANAYLPAGPSPQLRLSCWPMQRTDQVPLRVPYTVYAGLESSANADESMVVTAMRRKSFEGVMGAPPPPLSSPAPAVVAQQEELGDLKLYRVPERMSVNAKGQKQVAMIVQPDAKFRQVYRTDLGYNLNYTSAFLLEPNLVSMNEEVKGLGVPLPSGQAMIFENSKFGDQLVAQLKISDLAVGQKVELPLSASAQVRGSITILTRSKEKNTASVNLTNAKPYPVSAEIKLPVMVTNKSENVRKVDGRSVWFVTIPANGSAELAIEGKQP
jgi:hypothetical protein